MIQQQRSSRWTFLVLLACLFVLGAFLPHAWEHITGNWDDSSSRASNIFHKFAGVDTPTDVSYPTVEEIIQSASNTSSAPQAVVSEASAAILNQVTASAAPDNETEDSPSLTEENVTEKTTPTEHESEAEITAEMESEIAPPQEIAPVSPALSQPSSPPEPTAEQSPTDMKAITKADTNADTKADIKADAKVDTKDEPSLKDATPLLAHLPSVIKNLPELSQPALLDSPYPDTGLEPIKTPAAPDAQQSEPGGKTLEFWSEPTSLLSLLDELAKTKDSSAWAGETARLVNDLGPALARDAKEADLILDRLVGSSAEAERIAGSIADLPTARKLRQAAYAIQRRLDVWREMVRLGASALIVADKPKVDFRRLSLCLAEIDQLTNDSAEGRQWRKYLLVDTVKQWSSQPSPSEEDRQRKVAQQVLVRLAQTPMSVRQRQFLASQPVAAFCAEMRRWAAKPLTPAEVLRDIECYEQTCLPSDAGQLGRDLQNLAQSSDPQHRQLAGSVEMHYRNANLRVTLSEDLLNRLIPQQNMELAPVRDTVLGLPVRGQSLTSADVAVRLIPDPTHVRFALEVTGEVAALTSSTSGPATFYNDSESLYAARKLLEIDQKGIRLMPAQVDVRHQTRLRDVATDFDGIPLLGWVARGVARTQHEQVRPEANREARRKVADQARERIDAEAQRRLAHMVNNLNRNVFGPLYNLALEPTMVEAQTTPQRMTMRLRIAGDDQLGSHTPRPQAPADSLASFQINESLLNNALQRLQLEGGTFTLQQLVERISQRFQRPNIWQVNPEHEDLTVTFAKKDAVTVHCRDGQMILTISIAELSKEPRQWNDFQVRAFYRPQVEGRSAELVRDGVIHLIAPHANNGEQIALRGIFSRAFSKKDPVKLTPDRLLIDPKLQDLAITQLVIDDGWVGFALGPKTDAVQISQLPAKKK